MLSEGRGFEMSEDPGNPSPEDKRRGHSWERVLPLTEIVWSFRGMDPRTGRQFGVTY